MTPDLSIVVVTTLRPTLAATLASIPDHPNFEIEVLLEQGRKGEWGGLSRNRATRRAHGRLLSFMDDDDVYAPGAVDVIVRANPERWHVFRMRGRGKTLWKTERVEPGNVGTPMIVVPNRPDLPVWGDEYDADGKFAVAMRELMGEPEWHDETIALIRPHEGG